MPPAGIEPALLSEPDFESGASTNSAKGAAMCTGCGQTTAVKSQIQADPTSVNTIQTFSIGINIQDNITVCCEGKSGPVERLGNRKVRLSRL